MKPKLHTKKNKLLVILTDGSTCTWELSRSISARDKIWPLSLDVHSHPFWIRKDDWDSSMETTSSQRTKFYKKYNFSKANQTATKT